MPQMLGSHRRNQPLTAEGIFRASIPVPESGCWIWSGQPNRSGYGVVGHERRFSPAHRASYVVHHGAIPEGLVVMHKCDTRLCVNPSHLKLGTRRDNNRDRSLKGRDAQKVTHEQAVAIYADRRAQSLIAAEYGISQSAVSNIKTGRRRRHITLEN